MNDPRESITNEPPPLREDRIQEGLPESRSPYQEQSDPYGADDDYDYRRFRRDSPLASRGSRLAARFVDGAFTILVALPGIVIGFALVGNVQGAPDDTLFLLALGVAGIGVLSLWIYQWYLLATQGQTLGKKAMRIRVVHYEDESNPGFGSAVLLREWLPNLIAQLPFFGGIFSLVNILCIFGADRRCIHDQFARTKVIEVFADQQPEPYPEESYP